MACLVTPSSVMADMKLAMREQATGRMEAPWSATRNSRSVFCFPPLNLIYKIIDIKIILVQCKIYHYKTRTKGPIKLPQGFVRLVS